MSRLGREKKREQKRDAGSAAPRTPIDVRVPVPVPAADASGGSAGAVAGAFGDTAVGASVGGVPVVPAEGEEIQKAVLERLHRIALAFGHPVLATIHDERMGYVIPLRVDLDGSSHLTGDPVPTQPGESATSQSAPPGDSLGAPPVTRDRHTHVLRPVEEPVRESAPTFPMRAVPEPGTGTGTGTGPAPEAAELRPAGAPPQGTSSGEPTPASAPSGPQRESAPTFRMRPVPQWVADQQAGAGQGQDPPAAGNTAAGGTPPGTVAAPTGAFGPPPPMDPVPDPTRRSGRARTPEHAHAPEPREPSAPTSGVKHSGSQAAATRRSVPGHGPTPDLALAARFDPDPEPTPARGFDAVAEAVLGDEPITAPGDETAPALLAEPMGRINDAVRGGRTEEAARLAEETAADASGRLGAEHPEVLRLRELTAYIAYLAGEPLRALRLSLELVGVHRRLGDAEAAYGNVQSAATAWRAVRDPARGLELGRELIDLWAALAAEGGPAAEESGQLESVRSRMSRLAERARAARG